MIDIPMNPPTRIGRYEIIRRLGKSMTDVYLAMDTVENRKVALKLVPRNGDRVTRLVMEAERRGAAIQQELHTSDPRMVEIYEYGDLDGYFFVAMQFVEGRTVADLLAADRVLDPCRAAVIALEICEQLAKFHASESAVVHGDIKPSNIHLSPNDTVRLLDFGIAKTLRADCNATGHQFGSPSYCSPERLTRAEVDPQSDLWALGATLYEMLAGAAVPGRRYAQAGGADPVEAAAPGAPGLVPGGVARHHHEGAGAGRAPAVSLGGRVPRGPAALPGAQADPGGDGAAPQVESQRHPGGGARLPAPGDPDGAAQARAQPAAIGCGGIFRHRHVPLDRWYARLAGVAVAGQRGGPAVGEPAARRETAARGEPGAVVRGIGGPHPGFVPRQRRSLAIRVRLAKSGNLPGTRRAAWRWRRPYPGQAGAGSRVRHAGALEWRAVFGKRRGGVADEGTRPVRAGILQGARRPRAAPGVSAHIRVLAARSRKGDDGICGGGAERRRAGTPRGGAAGRRLPHSGAPGVAARLAAGQARCRCGARLLPADSGLR